MKTIFDFGAGFNLQIGLPAPTLDGKLLFGNKEAT